MRRTQQHLPGWGLGTLVVALLLVSACASGDAGEAEAIVAPTTTSTSTSEQAGTPSAGSGTSAPGALDIAVTDLEVGTCFDDPAFAAAGTSTVSSTTRVQCFDPHDAEVYAVVGYTQGADADFPGDDAVRRFAEQQCFDRFEDFVGLPFVQSSLDIATLWPTEDSWADGDRQATCAVFHREHEKLAGTMDGAER